MHKDWLNNNFPKFALLFYRFQAERPSLYTSSVKLKHWSSKLALNVIEERSKASFGRLPAVYWSRRLNVYNNECSARESFAEVISDEILSSPKPTPVYRVPL
jgi:hypothetical protein